MSTAEALRQQLLHLDRQSYGAYKSIKSSYAFLGFTLIIDHVQGDPFAAPSRLRVIVPQKVAGFPSDLYATSSRSVALRDYLNRQFDRTSTQIGEKRGSGKSGLIAMIHPGQQVLERSSVLIDAQQVEARFVVGLPAQGRSILGRQAAELLCEVLPEVVARSLHYKALNAESIQQHVETIEDADWLRQQLAPHNLVAFIPNGAILPRRSGVDDRPLETGIPFQSSPSLQVEFDRPNHGKITGMGIPRGVTLIVGGGYHGKSTLLQAISLGVYNHVPGDGREQVVTDANAMKIRAEDGRSITAVNISPFINHLPQGRSTTQFSTANASGSTSQAANIIEALEVGATVLLVDEDTSATNFMIRDRRMQALISKDKEPITPFVDKIRQLYTEYGVSTILVMGGSGDYFEVADTVIAMTEFEPEEVTDQAKSIAQAYSTHRQAEGGDRFGTITPRYPVFPAEIGKLKVRDSAELVLGNDAIDLSAVEQLVEVGQLRAMGAAMIELQQQQQGTRSLRELVSQVLTQIQTKGLDALSAYPQGDLVQFRSLELAAVMNRWRSIEVDTARRDD